MPRPDGLPYYWKPNFPRVSMDGDQGFGQVDRLDRLSHVIMLMDAEFSIVLPPKTGAPATKATP
jgi:hypothetical protein